MQQFNDSIEVLPGQGITRDFKEQGVDYSFVNGHIAYKPADFFTLQAGHGRNFIGDGHRSLMLSDFATAYPYLKFTTNVWKFQYTNLFTQFSHYQDRSATALLGDGYPQKGGSFHYLSTRIGKRFDLGLFEGVIWQRQDSAGNYRGFDPNYYNPVIFYRPIEFSLGSPDNMIMGLNASYIIAEGVRAYGQFVLTDFNFEQFRQRNQHIVQKVAFQLGVVERFTVGQTKFRLQQEWNQSRPFMYAHKVPELNYTHLNHALAHPLGANFIELVLNATAFVGDRWVLRYHGVFAQVGLDTDSTYHGNNIYRAERDVQTIVGHGLLDGLKTTILNQKLGAYYIINPHSRLQAGAEVIYRSFVNSQTTDKNLIFQLKLSTSLYNFYQDF